MPEISSFSGKLHIRTVISATRGRLDAKWNRFGHRLASVETKRAKGPRTAEPEVLYGDGGEKPPPGSGEDKVEDVPPYDEDPWDDDWDWEWPEEPQIMAVLGIMHAPDPVFSKETASLAGII